MGTSSASTPSVISLPKGGGALQGIGEKFAPDLHTGTGNFTVPIALPTGRNSFQPHFSLSYSTGNGNGPFGLGWSLSIPAVTRKTSQGIPRYRDASSLPGDPDTFILSGTEDLVPVGDGRLDTTLIPPLASDAIRYRPRTEGLFGLIDRHRGAGHDYWEVRSKDGLISYYGSLPPNDPDVRAAAVIRDPNPARGDHVFTWKLVETRDPFGNRITYEYQRDTGRDDFHHWDQLYLRRIRYVDFTDTTGQTAFLVSVQFLYDDDPDPDGGTPFARRPDPFSEYRAGFEIRTRRRCKVILVTTHARIDRRVRAYRFVYLDERSDLPIRDDLLPPNAVSLLSQVEMVGYDDRGVPARELPPLEFAYTRFEPARRSFAPVTGPDLPARSLAAPDHELGDLTGDGLPDILQMNGVVRYWRNLGGGRFDRPREMATAPAGVSLEDPGVQLIDANGDGRLDLLVTTERLSGYFPMGFRGAWDHGSFTRYEVAPSFSLEDADVRLVDLDGDGVTDAIRSGTRLDCFFNDPHHGWRETRSVDRQALEVFPNVNFSDPRVRWADMSGDGLQDIVLVYDGKVEYWPNLGRGDWGPRVRMANAPRFPIGYRPSRILLGDVDGDGLADLVYVDNGAVTLWINQSGNGWSDPIVISGTPRVTDVDAVRLADLLGTGVSGVLWTADADALPRPRMFFLDFTGQVKPYLLNEMNNHIGAATRVEYASSTQFYLADEARPETRWKTALPFPVQVVARVEVIDELSKGKLTTEYRYHHGYWDGTEREFRGFGRVEQIDTETFDVYNRPGLHGQQDFVRVSDQQQFSPPTLTRTWFHQGPVGDESGEWTDDLDLSAEFWPGDAPLLDQRGIVGAFLRSVPEDSPQRRRIRRDALRALRGSILRTELYALDGDPEREARPFTVTECAYGLREEAAPVRDEPGRRRVFFPHLVAQRTTQWERGDDPLTQFTFTEDYDTFGQPRLQTQIACPRGWRTMEDTPAAPYLATRTRTTFAAPVASEIYTGDRIATSTTFEFVTDSTSGTGGKRILDLLQLPDAEPALKIIGQTLHFYDGDAFTGRSLGDVGEFGALVRTETLVLTEDILQAAYGSERLPYLTPSGNTIWTAEYPQDFRNATPARAGYVFRSGGPFATGFFTIREQRRYDFHEDPAGKGTGLVTATRDPLGRDTVIEYDSPFRLLPAKVADPVGLITSARHDYRVLQPERVTDANGNHTDFSFTPLGLLRTTAVTGKAGEGDQRLPSVVMDYEFRAFDQSPPDGRQPILVRTTRCVHHDTEIGVPLPERDETIATVEYSDGFGRLLQTRTQAEDVLFGNPVFGGNVIPGEQSVRPADIVGRARQPGDPPNVVVSGWQVYDNKGRVVEKFEPFFDQGWNYASPRREQFGAKVSMFYDPRGHVVRTHNPDGSEQRVVFGVPGTIENSQLGDPEAFEPTPWEAYTYDANDNAGRTHATESRSYENHWNTPTSIRIDAMGRTIESVERTRAERANTTAPLPRVEEYRTRMTYDVRGNLLTVTDALGRLVFRYGYDLANRKLRVDSLDAGIRNTVLDAAGNPLEQRDSKGAVILHAYDDLNRPTRLWARDDRAARVTLREHLEYGDGGRADQHTAVRNANRDVNRLGRLHEHYDEAGRLVFERYDFKGNVLEKVRRVIGDGSILSLQALPVDWQPPAGRTLDEHAAGLLDSREYRTSLGYDALNRVTTLRYPQDVENRRRELSPHYNRAGALERVTVDGDVYVERIAYNAKGQRALIAYGNGLMSAHAHEAATFRLRRLWTGRYSRDADGLTYRPSSPGQPLQDLAYEYDLAGNVLAIRERTPGCGVRNTVFGADALDRAFTYDPLYRLFSATGRESTNIPSPRPWTDDPRHGFGSGSHGPPNQDNAPDLTRLYIEAYRYDPAGNLLSISHRQNGSAWARHFGMGGLTPQQWQQEWPTHLNDPDGWADAPGNRLTHVGDNQTVFTATHAYDANGNLIREMTSRRFEWDHSDRMKSFRTQAGPGVPSLQAHYLYDAGGQRVKKLVRRQGGAVEVTVYIDGVFEHHVEGTVQNNTLHVMDNQSRIALLRVGKPFAGDATPPVKYHLGDHLGSSGGVTGGATAATANAFINREEYTPYGETSFGSFALNRCRFSGKERDEESGLYYFGARYYAPWLARWSACDPLGARAGVNVYRYTNDNPLTLVDPIGLQPTDQVKDAGAPTPGGGSTEVAGAPEPAVTFSFKRPAAPSNQDAAPTNLTPVAGGLSSAKQAAALAHTPVDVSGKPLQGPLHLWSGQGGKAEAKAAIAGSGSGWMMSQTPQHELAKQAYANALREAAGEKYPGTLFTDEQLFQLADEGQLKISRETFESIWHPPSAQTAKQAALSGGSVQQHQPRTGSVQMEVEMPTVRKWGAASGGTSIGLGGLQILGATQEKDPTLRWFGYAAGGTEVVGGTIYLGGSLAVNAPTMTLGSTLMTVGGTAGAGLGVVVLAKQSIEHNRMMNQVLQENVCNKTYPDWFYAVFNGVRVGAGMWGM
jgi:RHS repeat-associated protein